MIRDPAAPHPVLAGFGALLAACGVALAAYASHGVDGAAREPLLIAALFAFGHGVALAALARAVAGRLGAISLWLLLAGTLGFSGALVSKHLLGIDLGRVAPIGGSTLIIGWLLQAVSAFGEPRRS